MSKKTSSGWEALQYKIYQKQKSFAFEYIARTPYYRELKLVRDKFLEATKRPEIIKPQSENDNAEQNECIKKINEVLPKLERIRERYAPVTFIDVKVTHDFINGFKNSKTIKVEISLDDIQAHATKNVIINQIDELLSDIIKARGGVKDERIRKEHEEELKAWDLKQEGFSVDEIAVKIFSEKLPKQYIDLTPGERECYRQGNDKKLNELFNRDVDDKLQGTLVSLKEMIYRYIRNADKKILQYQEEIKKL